MLDVDLLLRPIAGASPAGPNLRLIASDTNFRDIDELRREEDPSLTFGGEAKRADWNAVLKACTTVLAEKTKDLELAAWLVQALAHRAGWAGVQAGLGFLQRLLSGYWETLHPGWDEGEIVLPVRARPLSWLGTSHEFLSAVRAIPVTAAFGDRPRSWQDYEDSRRVEAASRSTDASKFRELVEAGLTTPEQWQAAFAGTDPAQLDGVGAAIAGCQDELRALDALCSERFGESAPYFTDLSNLLIEIVEHLQRFAAGGLAAAGDADFTGELPAAPATRAAAAGAAGLGSREQAYRQLKEAADYLRRTEPHSPVPALVDRAIRWGEMPFNQLFKDVIRDDNARRQIIELLGLPYENE
jgi:type VI secretion system protein ImpA